MGKNIENDLDMCIAPGRYTRPYTSKAKVLTTTLRTLIVVVMRISEVHKIIIIQIATVLLQFSERQAIAESASIFSTDNVGAKST